MSVDLQILSVAMSEPSAKSKAERLVADCQRFGHRFRPGVVEAVERTTHTGMTVDGTLSVLNEYLIPPGIQMPWGVTVQPLRQA